ncbi:hypothetical protein FQN54_003876 [Arachnomyces sp. PD_36]|nr:hypothetical protein FQN54_003876 [Arachnomyces sp. PD_36]
MDGRDAARDAGSRLRRLSIVNLKLSGFVIDAGPLSTFFDVHRLKTVEFGCGCIDAGILLPIPMKGITIITPRFHSGNISTIPVVRPPQAGVVELEDGRVVARWPIWKVSGAFAQIRGHLAMRAEKKAKEETETKGKKAKKEKDAKGKGKAVDQGEVQTMLDQLLPYRLKPQTPPTPSPPRRRRGLGFFSLRSRSHSNFDDANNYRD